MKLSEPQQKALEKLSDKWQSAYLLQTSIRTLDALVKKGLAQRRTDALGSIFSPSTANEYRKKQ